MQSQHFFLVSLFGREPVNVHAIRAEGQVHRGRCQRKKPPLLRLPEDGPGHRSAGTHVVAGRRPQEVGMPHRPQRPAIGQRNGRRDDSCVHHVVDERACNEWLGRLAERKAHRPGHAAHVPEGEAGGLHREHERCRVEDASRYRIAAVVAESRLQPRAHTRHEHRQLGADEQQGGEVHAVGDRKIGRGRAERDPQAQAGCQRRGGQQHHEEGRVRYVSRTPLHEYRGGGHDDRRDVQRCAERLRPGLLLGSTDRGSLVSVHERLDDDFRHRRLFSNREAK